jgi:hypothetical protein
MKEAKLIEIKNKVDALTRVVKYNLQQLNEINTLAKGTLTAFQLHLGEKKWEKLVEKLKDAEKKDLETKEKKLDLDVE